MNFLPFENITYKTKLSEIDVVTRLHESVEPSKTFRFTFFGGGSSMPYEGEIGNGYFEIKRIIGYRNSFLPQIKGTISRDTHGTTINVKMRLNMFVIVFLVIWFSGVGLGFVALLSSSLGEKEFDLTALIPLGMLLFAYLLSMGGFKFESHKSKKDLAEIFDGQIEE